jgi:pimeloyl-ACP methyl ester carboxylesterase
MQVPRALQAKAITRTRATRPRKPTKLLRDLGGGELLVRVDWQQWLGIEAPYRDVPYTVREVTTRYHRNGYDWDIHGRLYLPKREAMPGTAFFLTHGGAGSEMEVHETPDGRPGLAAVLAAQGFRCLAVTYPGHYPPGGVWATPVAKRQPVYLLDRTLPLAEIRARNLRCTFDTIVDGMARLTDRHLAGHKILSFGHSTGGPMAMLLQRFLKKAEVVGLVGWASGGPDGWFREWVDWVGAKADVVRPIHFFARRSPGSFRASGYEDLPELTPWGGADAYMAWGNRYKSQMKTSLCDNQHNAMVDILKEYARLTGLPEREYLDHLWDPDPEWLGRTSVLLLTGENDRNHWFYGETENDKLETFMGAKFALRTPRTRVVLVPKYGHFGYVALHNEKIAYAWLWALKAGFFAPPKAKRRT